MDAHQRFMRLALDLAARGRGRTNPNPMVGAVVVKEKRIIGTGYHQAPGEPHAELIALREAGIDAKGATLYVNLEPCCHYGRTPPCVEALVEAGIERVVVAMVDPNPQVNGKGIEQLRKDGIEVKVGVLEDEARRLNEVFTKFITTGEPFVTVKTAMSFDGKIATRTGDSRWISGESSRHQVHLLRSQVDGIVVGINTILQDDPLLTTRLAGEPDARNAARIILDTRGRLPLKANVVDLAPRITTIAAITDEASPHHRESLEKRGVEIWELPQKQDRVSLKALLKRAGERGFSSLMVEGGGMLNYSFLEENLIDKLYLFLAPVIIGGRDAPTPFSGKGVETLRDAWRISKLEVKQFGEDLLLVGYPKREVTKEREIDVYGNNRRSGSSGVL